MNVYDKLINETVTLLEDQGGRELEVNDNTSWPLLADNEFLMRRDIAFELGGWDTEGTCFNLYTSDDDLVGKDSITLYGSDLQELKGNSNYTRITLINMDPIDDPNKAYKNIKHLDFTRFKLIPKGYMVLSSSMDSKENVRVSKEAVANGLTFQILGNLIIDHYKKEPGVNSVQVIFITGKEASDPALFNIGKRADQVTNAFDHILKNIILDCAACPLQPICDDVEALRQLHFQTEEHRESEEDK